MENKLSHLAVILDGNGRWAESRGLPRVEGHKAGAERVKELLRNLKDTTVKYVTLYAFSTENWKRSEEEVSAIMHLLSYFLDEIIENLEKYNIRLLFSGSRDKLSAEILEKINFISEKTKNNDQLTVILALDYGGRREILDSVRQIAEKVQAGTVQPSDITEEMISAHLYHPEVPDPDLLIRTSGELRISNFLLWELSYSEFYFTDTYWPDFDKNELNKAISAFENRKRRFGGRK